MSDPNIPQAPDVPEVPDVPQVPDVPAPGAQPASPFTSPGAPPAPPAPPVYGAPVYGAPAYGAPVYGAPVNGAPAQAYGSAQPGGQQGYGAPSGYGAPTAPQAGDNPYASAPSGAPVAKQPILSILSLVAGVIALLGTPIGFVPIIGGIMGLFIPIAAVVLGFLGRSKEPRARGFWLTGLITGFASLALAILSIVIWILIIAVSPTTLGTGYDPVF